MNINYEEIFIELKDHLIAGNPQTTKEITRIIKRFFCCKFNNDTVLSSDSVREFMVDLLVTNFRPLEITSSNGSSTLSLTQEEYKVYLAVESELGGVGASSAGPVMRNAAEDFMKLMLINCKYKIMIFTSLPYSTEEGHILKRVNLMNDIFHKSPNGSEEVLLIHIFGGQPNTQVQTVVSNEGITGYVLSTSEPRPI